MRGLYEGGQDGWNHHNTPISKTSDERMESGLLDPPKGPPRRPQMPDRTPNTSLPWSLRSRHRPRGTLTSRQWVPWKEGAWHFGHTPFNTESAVPDAVTRVCRQKERYHSLKRSAWQSDTKDAGTISATSREGLFIGKSNSDAPFESRRGQKVSWVLGLASRRTCPTWFRTSSRARLRASIRPSAWASTRDPLA